VEFVTETTAETAMVEEVKGKEGGPTGEVEVGKEKGRREVVLEKAWARVMEARLQEVARVAIPMMETFGPLDAEGTVGGFLRVGALVKEALRDEGGGMAGWVRDWGEVWMGKEWVGLDEQAMYVRMVQLGGIRVLMNRER
jgi:hypothetical protein